MIIYIWVNFSIGTLPKQKKNEIEVMIGSFFSLGHVHSENWLNHQTNSNENENQFQFQSILVRIFVIDLV